MRFTPTAVLPKNILPTLRRSNNHIGPSEALLGAASADPAAVMQTLGTNEAGALQRQEDLFEIRLRQAGALGDIAHRGRTVGLVERERQQCS